MATAECQQNDIGRIIWTLRRRQGLSQAQLGQAMGVKISTVSSWETGARQVPLRRLQRLATILKVKPTRFLTGIKADDILASPAPKQAYAIYGGKLHVRMPVVLGKRELLKILAALLPR